MATCWSYSFGIGAAISTLLAVMVPAQANEPPTSESAYIPRAVDEVLFTNYGPFSNERGLGGQLQFILGTGGFPERRIALDADAIYDQYQYLLELQSRTDPTIRVPDLTSPYNTRLQYLPLGTTSGVVSGSDFVFESTP